MTNQPITVKFGEYGELRLYKDTDPNYPGACIMFCPANDTIEVQLAYVKGVPEKEQAVNGEQAGDISIYTYGDPYNEDYTHKETVRMEDILNSLKI